MNCLEKQFKLNLASFLGDKMKRENTSFKKYKAIGYIDERTYYVNVFYVDSNIYKTPDAVENYINEIFQDCDDGYDGWEPFNNEILNGFLIEEISEIT